MLKLSEFSVEILAAVKPLSLVLARSADEGNFLVGGTQEQPILFKLDGEHSFAGWPTNSDYDDAGLVIPAIEIEVDQTSIIDTNGSIPFGAISRRGQSLSLYARNNNSPRPVLVAVLNGTLPPVSAQQSVTFGRWQIVLGAGLDKRVLWTVDVTPKAEA